MLNTLVDAQRLACPTCRRVDEHGFHEHPLAVGEVAVSEGEHIVQGLLTCPGCGTGYPVIDGVAIIFTDVASWLRQQERDVFGRSDLAEPVASWLRTAWDDDAPPNSDRSMLATYGRALAPPPAPLSPLHGLLQQEAEAARDYLEARRKALVTWHGGSPTVLDAGCSVGATSLAWARAGARVVAMDHVFGPLRVLAQLLRRGRAVVPRWRHGGYDYVDEVVSVDTEGLAIAPIASDVANPPLRAQQLDIVAAYHLLDNLPDPVLFLRQAHGMLVPGGTLVSSSPYEWVSRITPRTERIGASIRSDPAAEPDAAPALRELLTGALPHVAPELAFQLGEERLHLPWVLQRHDRSFHVFTTHYLEAHRGGPAD